MYWIFLTKLSIHIHIIGIVKITPWNIFCYSFRVWQYPMCETCSQSNHTERLKIQRAPLGFLEAYIMHFISWLPIQFVEALEHQDSDNTHKMIPFWSVNTPRYFLRGIMSFHFSCHKILENVKRRWHFFFLHKVFSLIVYFSHTAWGILRITTQSAFYSFSWVWGYHVLDFFSVWTDYAILARKHRKLKKGTTKEFMLFQECSCLHRMAGIGVL